MKFFDLKIDKIEKKHLISFAVLAFLSSAFFFSIFRIGDLLYIYFSGVTLVLASVATFLLLDIYKKDKKLARDLAEVYLGLCAFFNVFSFFMFEFYAGIIFLSLFIILYVLAILKINYKYFVSNKLKEIEENVEIENILINSENYFDIKVNNLNSKFLSKLKNKFENILKLKIARCLFVFFVNASMLMFLTSVIVLFAENKVELVCSAITLATLAFLCAKLRGNKNAR